MKTNLRTTIQRALAILLVASFSTGSVFAQQPGKKPATQDKTGAKKTEKKEAPKKTPEKKKAEPKPITAVVGGDIQTVTNGTIRRGTILIQDGKILKIGQNIEVPKGATVIDAKGRVVTPGFISLTTSGIGLRGSGTKLADYLDPFDQNIRIALGVGITSACIQSGGGFGRRRRRSEMDTKEHFPGLEKEYTEAELRAFNPDFGDPDTAVCKCCGLPILSTEPEARPKPSTFRTTNHAIVKMSAGELEGMLVSEKAFYQVSPGSLIGRLNRHKWRKTIAATRLYLKELAEYEAKARAGDKKAKKPSRPVPEDVVKLVKKEVALRTSASSASQIREMVALAKELDYRLILDGVTEGWTIPDELADADVKVIISPRVRRNPTRGREDSTGSNIESSKIYEDAGVSFAVTAMRGNISLNGLAGRDLMALPLDAAFAVRGGCSERTALAAITIEPARMMGLEKRLGSLEEGKDADILILNGQPLDYRTYVETALVNGRVAYERAKDKVFPVYDRD